MSKFFRDCFTGRDNQTYDIGRVLGAIGIISFIVLCFVKKATPIEMSGGFATIITSVAGSLWIKRETEPKGG